MFFVQLPIGEAKSFRGIIDVVNKDQVIWNAVTGLDDGKTFQQKALEEAGDLNLLRNANDARHTLIEQVKF